MSAGEIVFAVVCAVPLLFVLLACTVFRKRWGHDILGWHDYDIDGFAGAKFKGTCKYCGKKSVQDSQGNWF